MPDPLITDAEERAAERAAQAHVIGSPAPAADPVTQPAEWVEQLIAAAIAGIAPADVTQAEIDAIQAVAAEALALAQAVESDSLTNAKLDEPNEFTGGEQALSPPAGQRALSTRTADAHNLSTGGNPKWRVHEATRVAWIDDDGNLFVGENYSAEEEAGAGTNQRMVANFMVQANTHRTIMESATITMRADPGDVDGRRAGPEGGYPHGGGSAPVTSAGGTTLTITGAGTGIYRVGQRITTTDGLVRPDDVVTIVGGTAVDVQDPSAGTLEVSAAVPAGAHHLFSIGRPQDICGNGAGAAISQFRGTPFVVPVGATTQTAGAKALKTGALMQIVTAEMPRDLTGNEDLGVACAIAFRPGQVGTDETRELLRLSGYGKVLIGEDGIGASGSDPAGPMVNVRGAAGADEVQRVERTGAITGGTWQLRCWAQPASTTTFGAPTDTADLAHDAAAATIATAVETALGLAPGAIVGTGGPINAADVTLTFSGTGAAKLPWAKLRVVDSALTGGGSLAVARVTRGLPSDGTHVLMLLRHGGSGTPTGSYLRVLNGAGALVWDLEAAGSVRLYSGTPNIDSRDAASGATNVRTSRVTGDSQARFTDAANGKRSYGPGNLVADAAFGRLAADILGTDPGDKLVANGGLGVGNSAAATVPGAVVRKAEVFDAAGASLGFVAIYNTIT